MESFEKLEMGERAQYFQQDNDTPPKRPKSGWKIMILR